MPEINRAILLDRDGVLNYPVLNSSTGEYEAPQQEKDFKLFPSVIKSLRQLIDLNYKLFVVSNQPDYAKGKTSLENLKLVHSTMHNIFVKNNINFTEYYYCYHHPKGVIPEYSTICECRKPGILFLKQARLKYSLDLSSSWMIGDRDSDIDCGQLAGTKTIMIKQIHLADKAGESKPDYMVNNLQEAVEIIKRLHKEINVQSH